MADRALASRTKKPAKRINQAHRSDYDPQAERNRHSKAYNLARARLDQEAQVRDLERHIQRQGTYEERRVEDIKNPASRRGDKLFKAREAVSTSVKINFGIALVFLIGIVVFRTQSPTTDLCGDSEVLPPCECTKFYN